jgi:hypothetical protein
MTKIKIELHNDLNTRLNAFKKIIDTVLEERIGKNDYLNIVISEGLKYLLKTVIPQDNETLWLTIENMASKNPKFVSVIIADTIKQGKTVNKEKLKEKMLPYIQ